MLPSGPVKPRWTFVCHIHPICSTDLPLQFPVCPLFLAPSFSLTLPRCCRDLDNDPHNPWPQLVSAALFLPAPPPHPHPTRWATVDTVPRLLACTEPLPPWPPKSFPVTQPQSSPAMVSPLFLVQASEISVGLKVKSM